MSVVTEFSAFGTDVKLISFTIFATVITWGLIKTLETSILAPLILSAFPGLDEDKKVDLGNGHKIQVGKFVTALIVWVALIFVMFLVWLGVRLWRQRQCRLASEAAAAAGTVVNQFDELQKAAANIHATAQRLKLSQRAR